MAKIDFGAEDTIHCLQTLKEPGPNGETVCFGFTTTVHYFGAGAWISDNGYALAFQAKGESSYESFLPLDAQKIAQLQELQAIPRPLPTYKIGLADYVMGYSLWWCLAIGFLVVRSSAARLRRW